MKLLSTNTEKLRQTEVTLKKLLIIFSALGLTAVIILFFLKAKFIFFVPVLVMPVIFASMAVNLKVIRTELKSRSSGTR